jgi:hypothetical protein
MILQADLIITLDHERDWILRLQEAGDYHQSVLQQPCSFV